MKYFFDVEFEEGIKECCQGYIWLISIGIAAEDGREYYAECEGFDWSSADPWLIENVMPCLAGNTRSRQTIRDEISAFCSGDDIPEFWAYVASYDWVALMQLFGSMLARPANWPNQPQDLKTFVRQSGIPKSELPTQTGVLHNALEDARGNRELYKYVAQRLA